MINATHQWSGIEEKIFVWKFMKWFGGMELDAERITRNLFAAKITKGSSGEATLIHEGQHGRQLLQSKFAKASAFKRQSRGRAQNRGPSESSEDHKTLPEAIGQHDVAADEIVLSINYRMSV
jgi:hypothetical protein